MGELFDAWQTAKDLEGNGSDLISRHLPGGTEENYERHNITGEF
jgi:hypothetical protein